MELLSKLNRLLFPCAGEYEKLGVKKSLALGFQHAFAMSCATILVPLLTGLDVGVALFCAGCGTPAEKARAQAPAAPTPAHAAGPACASCGAPLGAGDMFCMSCGAKVAALAVSAGAGVGDADLCENAGLVEPDLVEADGNVAVAPGGAGAPKGGE